MADDRKQRWLEGTYGKAVKRRRSARALRTTSGIREDPSTSRRRDGGLDERSVARRVPVHAGRAEHHVPGPLLDDAPVRGFGTRGVERALRYLLQSGRPASPSPSTCPADGRDSDHPRARARSGRWRGHRSIEDMGILSRDPARRVSTSMTINATRASARLYQAVASAGVAPAICRAIQNDLLRSTRPAPTSTARAIAPDHHGHLRLHREGGIPVEPPSPFRLPHPRGGLDGRAGGGLHARRRHRLRRAREAGADVDAFAAGLSFFFNAHNNCRWRWEVPGARRCGAHHEGAVGEGTPAR